MKLTEKVKNVNAHVQQIKVFGASDSVDAARKGYEYMAGQLSGTKTKIRVIEEFDIPAANHQIAVRLYRPEGLETRNSAAIIYVHGGWFMSGGLETHDAIARKLADATKAVTILVDYRLAPEYPFPAGIEDILVVTGWLLEHAQRLHIDGNQVGIVGDSAGAALALAVAMKMKEQLKFQVLIYPATDNKLNTVSWMKYADGPILSKASGIEAWSMYLSDDSNNIDPRAVPILNDVFEDISPVLVLLAEHDPLHDEGKLLAEKIANAGAIVEVVDYAEMIHGFMHMGAAFKEVEDATARIALFIGNCLDL
ncbi:alpha/beta hydrolase [Sphingobacterium sp. LRF_L2]|uniref:alpha/beta hydrolase n=1 Tax=Sphingobacterium sp. LRF_L2 TaxID=3369421 RepID=UPI003F5DA567